MQILNQLNQKVYKTVKSQISSIKLFTLLNNSINGVIVPVMKIDIVDLFRKSQQDYLTGQVNLKFQYPMTKTFTAVVPYGCTSFCPSANMPFGTNAGEACLGF
jgi:hypothetical protein